MMDFLRGLAPRSDADTMRAVPALPSRFAAARPLTAVSAPAPTVRLERVQESAAALSPLSATPPVNPVITPLQIAVGNVEATPAASEAPMPARHPGSEPSITRAREESKGPLDSSPAPREIRTPAHDSRMDGSRRSQGARIESLHQGIARSAPLSPLPRLHEIDAQAQLPAAVRPPLSADIVQPRASHGANQRPIVHVTIDRLEVRMPAVPPREKTVKPRAGSPRVSLADYLHGSSTPRGGGR